VDYTKDQGSLNVLDFGWSNLWKNLRTGLMLTKEDRKRLKKETRGDGAAMPPKSGRQENGGEI